MSLSRFAVSIALLLRTMAAAALLLVAQDAAAAAPADPVAGEIQHRLEQPFGLHLDGEQLDGKALQAFYQNRHWAPAWSAEIVPQLQALLNGATADGLPTEGFHLPAIARRRQTGAPPAALAEADLLLTDAVLHYAAAMRGQRIDPTHLDDDWFVATPPFDPIPFIGTHTSDIIAALQGLAPPYAAYQKLREQLAILRAIAAAGDWPKVPPGPTIKPGAADERIVALRNRLLATGELAAAAAKLAATPAAIPAPAVPAPAPAVPPAAAPAVAGAPAVEAAPAAPPPPAEWVYDDSLLAGVRLFQQRHGLADDGALGKQTILALNQSPAELAQQVAVTMERWRWLPTKLEDTHIIVNVPGAWMEVVEDGKAMVSMRTVVGDPNHPTPALHAQMTSLVLNPTWSVPASIATKEILPRLKKDPGYLLANDLVIVSDSFPPGSAESQGIGIDWNSRHSFPWMLRQKAGSDNALGHIKFNIPNSDDIYLHDTPNHRVFARANRALSHGCVRLDEPNRLALYVLRNKDWSADKLSQEIGKGTTRTIPVDKPLPVWLLYWTTWVDGDGVLQVRPDIYGRDGRLAEALAHPQPGLALAQREAPAPTKVVCEGCRIP